MNNKVVDYASENQKDQVELTKLNNDDDIIPLEQNKKDYVLFTDSAHNLLQNVEIKLKKTASLLDVKIGNDFDLQNREMHKIFCQIVEKNQEFEPKFLSILDKTKERTIVLTYDNNLVYYDQENNTLGCYGLLSQKLVLEKKVQDFSDSEVTRIVASEDNESYLIGFEDGSVHVIKAFNFQLIASYEFYKHDENSQVSSVIDIFHNQSIMVVCYLNGELHIYESFGFKNKTYYFSERQNFEYPIYSLQASTDGKILVFYCDNQYKEKDEILEYVVIFNLLQKKEINRKILNLNDIKEMKEDPNKLYILAKNFSTQILILRSEDYKGINIYTLEDGALISKIENMHTKAILSLCLLDDMKTLISAGKDKKIYIWNIANQRFIHSLQHHSDFINTLTVSRDQKYLFSGGDDQRVIVYFIQNWQKLCVLNLSFKIDTLQISSDSMILLATNKSGKIAFWQLQDQGDSIRLNFQAKTLHNALITPDNEFLFSSDMKNIEVWNLKSKIKQRSFDYKVSYQFIQCSYSNKYVFLSCEDYMLQQWNIQEMKQEHVFKCNGIVAYSCLDLKDEYLFVATWLGQLQIFNLKSKEEVGNLSTTSQRYHNLRLSNSNNFAILSCYNNKIHFVDVKDRSNPIFLYSHDLGIGIVCDFSFNPNDEFIIMGGLESLELILYDISEKKEIKRISGHSQFISYIFYIDNGLQALSSSSSEIILWDTKDWSQIFIFNEKCMPAITSGSNIHGLIYENQIKFWNQKLIDDISDKPETETNVQQSNMIKSDEKIVIKGPLNCLFPKILREMFEDNQKTGYINALQQNIIEPYQINILHYFSFENQTDCVIQCLHFGVKYIRDKFDNTPLEYAIQRNSNQCVGALLDFAIREQKIIDKMNSDEICKLILFSPFNLHDFFDSSFAIQERHGLQKFASLKYQPCIFFNDKNIIENEQLRKYFNLKNLEGEQPITIKSLKFKYNFYPGSNESLNFHQSQEKCLQKEIFKTEVIQNLLRYKWRILRLMGYSEFYFFLSYLIILMVHVYNLQNKRIEILLCIYCTFFGVFEAIQIIGGRLSITLNDFWKWMDYLSLILLIIYLVFEIGYQNQYGHLNFLLALVNFMSWTQGISKLRVFRQTRIFIYLVKQVIYEMNSFNVILIGSIFALSTTYTMLVHDATDPYQSNGQDYKVSIFQIYYLFHGDFRINIDGPFQSILFSIATFFLSLVMMNLIVAVMSDTYNSVMTNIIIEDSKQLNAMILIYENILFLRRNYGTQKYLFWLNYASQNQGEWTSVADHITDKLEKSQIEMNKNIQIAVNHMIQQQSQIGILENQMQVKFGESAKRQDQTISEFKKEIQSLRELIEKKMHK